MFTRSTRLVVSTATTGVFALTAAAAAAAQSKPAAPPLFVAGSSLIGADVASRFDSDTTGELDDLIVDIRSGRVVYAVVSTDDMAGTEDGQYVVPYGALLWNNARKRFQINASRDQLAHLPAFERDDMASLQKESWTSTLRGIFGDQRELNWLSENEGRDEYTWLFVTRTPDHVHGRIVDVEGLGETKNGSEIVCLTVEAAGRKHRVLTAPAWYAVEQGGFPAKGDKVTVTVVEASDPEGLPAAIASVVEVDGGRTIRFRDQSGVPTWRPRAGSAAMPAYLMLASDLDDGKVFAAGQEFGSINDVIYEVHSGTAAFAIASVGGLLGIGDTMYPLPCGAFTLDREQNIRLSMTADELKVAPKLSKDGVEDLSRETFRSRVCDFYGVKPKPFATNRSADWSIVEGSVSAHPSK